MTEELNEKKEKVAAAAEELQKEVKTDTEKMQDAVKKLKESGEELFAQQIKEIESKIELEKEKAAALAKAAREEATEGMDKARENISNKYGEKAWEVLKALALIAILYGVLGR